MAAAKFATIKNFITTQIEQGHWPEHSKVPSENELAQQFAVSRMTARRALQELTEIGLLTRSQGLGTFVACLKSRSSLLEIRNIADEITERGHQHHTRVLQLQAINAPSEIAIALELAEQSQVYYSQLIHLENNTPLQLEDRYINPNLVSDYLKQNFTQMTPHVYLSQIAPLTQATHTIEAVLPTATQCQQLELTTAEACLQITRRTWSAKGVVSVAKLTCPGSRYRLDSQLTL